MVTDDLTLEAIDFDDELPTPGVYAATVERVEPFTQGKYGPAFKLVFRITGGDWDGVTVEGIASRPETGKASKETKIWQWYKAALGEPAVGTKMQLTQMAGRAVQVMVEHKPRENGGAWARVKDVLPPLQTRRRTAPPPPPPMDDFEDEDELAGT